MLQKLHEKPLADPYVFQHHGEWHIYGTDRFAFRGTHLNVDSLRAEPFELKFPGRQPPQDIWGFHPYQESDGSFHAVATLHLGNFRTEIAYFRPSGNFPSKAVPTAWTFSHVLIPYAEGRQSPYETKFVRDAGNLYLVYCLNEGSTAVNIVAQKMKNPSTIDANSPVQVLLRPEGFRSEDRNAGRVLQIVEGPNIVPLGDVFVMFYSVGDFAQRNYKTSFAYSDHLIPTAGGTYKKVLVNDLRNVWESPKEKAGKEIYYLLQSEHVNWPNYVGNQVLAPGLANLVMEDGKPYLVFHGYEPTQVGLNPALRYCWKLPIQVNLSEKDHPETWFTVPVLK